MDDALSVDGHSVDEGQKRTHIGGVEVGTVIASVLNSSKRACVIWYYVVGLDRVSVPRAG